MSASPSEIDKPTYSGGNADVPFAFGNEPLGDNGLPLYTLKTIGLIESVFRTKNGTPRQANLTPKSRARIRIMLKNNPGNLLDGLQEFSHVWLTFMFNLNTQVRAAYKIRPPRLDSKVGVYASRAPHRPNPIGLSLAKIDRIDVHNATLHLTGIDLVHGTPILDIKPYIPAFDNIPDPMIPNWLSTNPLPNDFEIIIEEKARNTLKEKLRKNELDFYEDENDLIEVVEQILANEPRGRFRRKLHSDSNSDSSYQFPLDNVVVCCTYKKDANSVHVDDFASWFPEWNCLKTEIS